MSFLKRIQICTVGIALSLAAQTSLAEVVPVVSAKSNVSSLSANQVMDIFLGKTSQFPNGEPAVPLDQAEGSPIRDAFYMQFASKSAAQLKAYWSKIIFTGKGQPPREVSPSEKVKKVLADNPHLIGYIDHSEVDANVKVVLSSR
jgi:ABC-type phosphate transport system substrate-binding protein